MPALPQHPASLRPTVHPDRRRLLALLGGLALPMLAQAARTEIEVLSLDPLPQPPAQALADGVYWVPGLPGEVDGRNVGRNGNTGFIVGPQGVVAIDAGVSRRHGEALLANIERVTDRPVKLLLITHARQEFLFGAAAFRARGIPVAMQRATAGLMTSRCEGCLDTLRGLLGEAHMAGTEMFKPDQLLDGPSALGLIGRPLRLLSWGHSSGPGDLAVLDEASGVVFTGGLCDRLRVPDLQDSRLQGWRDALAALRALQPRQVVPGHGPVGDVGVIDGVEDYLRALEQRLGQLLDAGVPLSEVAERAELGAYAGWDQYEVIHRRNAALLFLRLEHAQLLR
ncbi:MBL fold metallo-hydrolase [Piscinibacter sp. Jin2]|uniref:MBL fold metallo-hydrolase n=1 Tax=Aquariibacter lacus TaxID=2801332 RepID=A0A9X0XG12_9BURK|nr:MBL fold metallo-hydrolase [Piscinibacter lacus]MBL0719308.1 MBL fold metallo-hydrolase [Piscinibacter lacus]